MAFPGILGHERSIALLEAALKSDRVHHAYLFSGPDGVGKEKTARLFAKALLCEQEVQTLRPCGECGGCRKVEAGSHPDLVMALPESEAVARGLISRGDLDKAPSRDLRVAEVRELERRIRLPPYEARHKVVIITPADRMNQSAQNALLKTLEEPPSSTTLVLVTAAVDKLLPTVRSRCAKIPFGPLPLDLVASEVALRLGCDLTQAMVLAALGGGSLGAALALDQETLERRRALLESLWEIQEDDGEAITAFAESFAGDRAAADEQLQLMAIWYRDVLAVSSGAASSALVNSDQADKALADSRRIPSRELVRRLSAIAAARRDIERNVNARLVVEGLLCGFSGGG